MRVKIMNFGWFILLLWMVHAATCEGFTQNAEITSRGEVKNKRAMLLEEKARLVLLLETTMKELQLIEEQIAGPMEAAGGGWLQHNDSPYDTPVQACDITRVESADIDEATFKSVYHLTKPVLITNIKGNWSTLYQKHVLAKKYGHRRVKVGISKHIPRHSGDGYTDTPLNNFLTLMTNEATDPIIKQDSMYVFDQNEFLRNAPELVQALKLPLSTFFPTKNRTMYFCLGTSLSGVQFHKHADGWNLQIYGKKRWLLYPPEQMPPRHYPTNHVSVSDWLDQTFPTLPPERRPLSCTVQPDELLYIPESWYHATLNIGDSVGVAAQVRTPFTDVQQAWNAGNEAHRNEANGGVSGALQEYRRILELQPNTQEAAYMVGLALTEIRRVDEAKQAILHGLALSPDHSESVNNLGVAYSMDQNRLPEALHQFRKAAELNPLHEAALANQAKVMAAIPGEKENAKEVIEKHEQLLQHLRQGSL